MSEGHTWSSSFTVERLLVTGSRVWPDAYWFIAWDECHRGKYLILGDCPTGADLWARRFAAFYQRPHRVHEADWGAHGPAAGPIRNSSMVGDSPTGAVALVNPAAKNNGTRDCYRKCRTAGLVPRVRRAS